MVDTHTRHDETTNKSTNTPVSRAKTPQQTEKAIILGCRLLLFVLVCCKAQRSLFTLSTSVSPFFFCVFTALKHNDHDGPHLHLRFVWSMELCCPDCSRSRRWPPTRRSRVARTTPSSVQVSQQKLGFGFNHCWRRHQSARSQRERPTARVLPPQHLLGGTERAHETK